MISILEEFDLNELILAKEKIQKVYEYYYGDCTCKSEVSRLETILKKLNQLITREEEK